MDHPGALVFSVHYKTAYNNSAICSELRSLMLNFLIQLFRNIKLKNSFVVLKCGIWHDMTCAIVSCSMTYCVCCGTVPLCNPSMLPLTSKISYLVPYGFGDSRRKSELTDRWTGRRADGYISLWIRYQWHRLITNLKTVFVHDAN